MKFATWVFRIVGVIGLLLTVPLYFIEAQIGRDLPPAITHPEYYYGFLGVTLAWQVLFLLLARDPVRYRPLMVAAMLEKASYGFAGLWLFSQGRVPALLGFGLMDLALGAFFVAAYMATAKAAQIGNQRPVWL